MFDIGFWELALIAVVALLVVGPERLPKLARTAGLWIGRGRRLISSVKADIERELKAEELKQILRDQAKSNPLEEILNDTKQHLEKVGPPAGRVANQTKPGADPKPVDAAKQGHEGN